MKLDGLKDLYRDMKTNKFERYKIQFTFNNVFFDVFFFIDESPFLLMFGVKTLNFYFEVPVKAGFQIDPILDINIYSRLIAILNLNSNPGSPFKPNYFFEEFNKNIPQNVVLNNIPKSHEVGQFRREVEENDKIYFLGWKDNKLKNEKVSPENLKKTRLLLGNEAYERCDQKNISSRWTNDIKFAQDFFLPN